MTSPEHRGAFQLPLSEDSEFIAKFNKNEIPTEGINKCVVLPQLNISSGGAAIFDCRYSLYHHVVSEICRVRESIANLRNRELKTQLQIHFLEIVDAVDNREPVKALKLITTYLTGNMFVGNPLTSLIDAICS